MEEILQSAQAAIDANPVIQELYVTSDLQVFETLNPAQNHASRLEDTTLTRVVNKSGTAALYEDPDYLLLN